MMNKIKFLLKSLNIEFTLVSLNAFTPTSAGSFFLAAIR